MGKFWFRFIRVREWFLLILRGDGEGFCIKIGTLGLVVLPDSYTKLTVCNGTRPCVVPRSNLNTLFETVKALVRTCIGLHGAK